MPTTTKRDLTNILSQTLSLTKAQSHQLVDAFFQAMTEAIIQGERIEIRGFGVWRVIETSAKPNARNPNTGERVSVPRRRNVGFKEGKVLKEELSKPVEVGE